MNIIEDTPIYTESIYISDSEFFGYKSFGEIPEKYTYSTMKIGGVP